MPTGSVFYIPLDLDLLGRRTLFYQTALAGTFKDYRRVIQARGGLNENISLESTWSLIGN